MNVHFQKFWAASVRGAASDGAEACSAASVTKRLTGDRSVLIGTSGQAGIRCSALFGLLSSRENMPHRQIESCLNHNEEDRHDCCLRKTDVAEASNSKRKSN